MPIAHQTGRVRSGDVEIFYRRLGTRGRTPVLVVHGLSYFSYDWLPVAQALGAEREVVAMDMRGFGDSDWSPRKDYGVPTMAGDIVHVLDHLGWKRAVLVGHSMGGRSTTYVAAKQAERVAALALIDFTPDNAPAGGKRVAQIVGNMPDAFPSVEEAMKYFNQSNRERFEAYLKPVAGGFAVKRDTFFRDQFRRILETGERPKLGVDMWQLIGEVRCPILSMRGSRSDMYAPQTKEKMRAANARVSIVEVDAGHNIAGENPQAFLAALRPFLASLEEKSHAH
jgi:pimeloyl-ACP methyl ester carboxylesterase